MSGIDEKWSEWITWYAGPMSVKPESIPQNSVYQALLADGDMVTAGGPHCGDLSFCYDGSGQGRNVVAYRYRLDDNTMTPESDMHEDLEHLARNVTEWPRDHSKVWIDRDGEIRFDNGISDDFFPDARKSGSAIEFSFNEWLQARKDLGLIMSDEEEEVEAEEWERSVPEGIKAPLDGMTASKYSAYFKDVRHIDTIDVYRVVDLFGCEKHGHPISHAAKKLLLSGSRTGGKDVEEDVREAIDTLRRWLEMRKEDGHAM